MRKITLTFILLAGCMQHSFAQTEPAPEVKKEKTTDHLIGVQMNALIRQVFNFNNSTAVTNVNPYLLTYSVNSIKSGWGLRVGVGYNYSSTANNDGITESSTNINDLQARIGVDKSVRLSRKWSTGFGLDLVVNTNDDKTTATIGQFSDTTTTVTKSTKSSFGGGPMGWLRYNVTDRIVIGTEASFYYVTGTENNKTAITQTSSFGGGTTTTETTSKPKISQGVFNSPVVFFLMVKF